MDLPVDHSQSSQGSLGEKTSIRDLSLVNQVLHVILLKTHVGRVQGFSYKVRQFLV